LCLKYRFVLIKQHLREVLNFCFIERKVRLKPIECLSKFMVTLLQLINHVENGFDVSRMEISALKTSLTLDSQKIRRQRIRGITRRRSESNARGAYRIIGGNSTSLFCTIESHENDSKIRKRIECLMNWNREKGDFSLANSWFKDNIEKVFCIGLWLEMRSGYSTKTPRKKNTTLSPVNRCHRPQHQHYGRTFMVRRSCSVSGRTKRVLFTMSC